MAELDQVATSDTALASDVHAPPLDWCGAVEAAEAVATDLGWNAQITAAPEAARIRVVVPTEQTS
ncbi:MAG TPA: hypothetical protein VF541_02785, partial [Longimicrobium sp.]